MNKHAFAVLLAIPLLLSACAFGYRATGSLSDVPGELLGKGYPGNRGGGRFSLSDRDGRLSCDGQALPAKALPNSGNCADDTGEGEVLCSDGRKIPVRWQAISCRAWRGSGVDAQGNRLEFRVERR